MATKTFNIEDLPAPDSAPRTVAKISPEAESEIKTAVEFLIRTATKHNLLTAGWVFGPEPMYVLNFGNCGDCAEGKLFELLCQMYQDRKADGLVIHEKMTPVC